MHKIEPHRKYRLIPIILAVRDEEDRGRVADEISALLSENGCANPESAIADWRYNGEEGAAIASEAPEEGELFNNMPKSYSDLRADITKLPPVLYSMLLADMVRAAYEQNVFKPGGAALHVQKVEKELGKCPTS